MGSFIEEVIKFSKKENNHGDVVCVAVMSHGMDPGQSNDRIFASDGQTIDIEKDVLATFNNISSPHLHGKPKLFYIQACRGNEYGMGVEKGQDAMLTSHSTPELKTPVDRTEMSD